MRLLIPVFSPATGTWGGLTRVLAIAEAAERAGHPVAFCASGYVERTLRRRGYTVYSTPPSTMLGLPAFMSRILERRSQRASIPVKPGRSFGNMWLVLLGTGMARARYLRQLVTAEIEAAEAFQADILFTEFDLGAFLTSAITGLPLALAYAHIATHGSGSLPWKLVQRATASVLRSYGRPVLNPDELCFGERVLKIIPSIPELDDTDPGRGDVHFVGRLIAPIHAPSNGDFFIDVKRRYVFVYVGTGSISLNSLEEVLPRLFPAEGDRICLVGAQTIDKPYRLGAVEFRSYVPAEALLPHCDWTICHGGQNTIIHSLLHGVPLIIFPGPIFERRYNAKKVELNGAGFMGEANEFTKEWLQASLSLQSERACQAQILSERLLSFGGPPAAVEAISRWTGEP
jgi:hypothetical protein